MSEFVRIIDPSGKTLRNDLYNSPPDAVSYIIFKDGGLIKAKNGRTGQIEFSGTDAATVIQQALNALTPDRIWKEKVVCKGNFTVTKSILLPSYTILEVHGVLKASDGMNYPIVRNADRENGNTDIEFIGEIDGSAQTGNAGEYPDLAQCLQLYKVTRGRVKGRFKGSYTEPVHLGYCSDIDLDVIVSDSQTCEGISIFGSENVKGKITARSNSTVGALIESTYRSILDIFSAFNGDGVELKGAHRNIIKAETRENTYQGIKIHDGYDNTVLVNSSNNGLNGLYAYDEKRLLVIGNTRENHDAGVFFDRVHYSMMIVSSYNESGGGVNAFSAIVLKDATRNLVLANVLDDRETKQIKYGIEEQGTADNNIITGCLDGWATGAILRIGANTIVKDIIGYATENSGVATLSGDGTTDDFSIGAHGLAVTDPNKIVVKVSPISSDAIAASPCVGYVDPADNTLIRVKFATAPASGTDNVTIAWEAQVV